MFPIRLADLRFAPGGRAVLAGIDLELGGEGITVVLGPNGAGKSVLLRVLAGLQAPDGGTLHWGGRAQPDGAVSIVFQQPALIRASVRGNVRLALQPLRLARAECDIRVGAVLARVGLAHRGDDAARLLSGGEKQRLALARAWVARPRLLLLDEPTANLDPTATEAVEAIVREIRTDGARVVMATHNLAQALRLADDIVFLADGRVVEHVPARRFFSRPQSTEARLFLQGELPWRISFDS
jgi:tungstate transport system ATP-binding protein